MFFGEWSVCVCVNVRVHMCVIHRTSRAEGPRQETFPVS